MVTGSRRKRQIDPPRPSHESYRSGLPIRLDRSTPAKMGSKPEGIADLVERARPGRVIRDHANIAGGEGNEVEAVQTEGVAQQGYALPRKSHQRCGHTVHGDRVSACDHHSARFGVRSHRTVAFTPNHAVDD